MTDLLLLGRLEDALVREGCPVCHEVGRALDLFGGLSPLEVGEE